MKEALDIFYAAIEALHQQAQKHMAGCDCEECNRIWGEFQHAVANLERAEKEHINGRS